MHKKLIYFSAFALAYSASAATFNWKGSTANWYYHIDNTAMWDGSGTIGSDSDLVIDYSNAVTGNKVTQIADWSNITVNSLKISNVSGTDKLNFVFRSSNNSTFFKINNDLSMTSGVFSIGAYGWRNASTVLNGTLKVDGNLNVGSSTAGNLHLGMSGSFVTGQDNGGNTAPLYMAEISKNTYIAGGSSLFANVGLSAAGAATDINSPDLQISGVVVGYNGVDDQGKIFTTQDSSVASKTWGSFFLQNKTNTYNGSYVSNGGTSVISVGGLSGSLIVRNKAFGVEKGVLSVLVLNNSQNYTLTSAIGDDYVNGVNFCTQSKVKVVMNGTAEQRFTSRTAFSGGLEMRSGILLVDSAESGANGIDISDKTTFYTHGAFDMLGGTFGFYYVGSRSVGGSFSFSEMCYNSGTIKLNIYENGVDKITLDKISSEKYAGELYTTSSDSVEIDFVFDGIVDYLVDNEQKIISWSGYDSNIAYKGNDMITSLGEKASAVFVTKADGLYVKYVVAVPEPAAFAGIFGALALVVALRRRFVK